MLSLISFKTIPKLTIKQRILGGFGQKAVLDCYKDSFGTINVYNLYYYKNKEKAFASLLNFCDKNSYTANSTTPPEYLQALSCKQLLEKEKNYKGLSLSLYFVPEKAILTELCRAFSKVYIIGNEAPSFLEDIWKECGTLPTICALAVKTDFILYGNEAPIIKKLATPFCDICPADFSYTLFAGLLYKENGIFIH